MRADILKESGAFQGKNSEKSGNKKENSEASGQKKNFGEKQTKIDNFAIKAKKKFEDELQRAIEESKKLYEMEHSKELEEINEQINEFEKNNEKNPKEKTPEKSKKLADIPESEEEKIPTSEKSENLQNFKKRKDFDPFLDGLMEKYSYKKIKGSSNFSSEDSMIEMKEFEISDEFTQMEKKLKISSQINSSK